MANTRQQWWEQNNFQSEMQQKTSLEV